MEGAALIVDEMIRQGHATIDDNGVVQMGGNPLPNAP